MRINNNVYNKGAVNLAKFLIGKILCRKVNDKIIKVRISETEAYCGFDDTASHAHKGKTPRNEVMFYEGGYAYVYLCYGMHYMFNVVSGKEGNPEAVLIRGATFINKDLEESKSIKGPGKLTKNLFIDKSLNKENLKTSDKIWIEDDGYSAKYEESKRIGIAYAADADINRLWRFTLK